MSAPWRNDEEEFRLGGARGPPRSKPRFSFTEVKLLLEAVKRNRDILLKKFNQGVSAEAKKQTWTEITNQINALGENHREVRQIMKKWADLKCDGKRRLVALRGPNGSTVRKKTLGPVERMVHKILIMSPRGDGDSDPDFDDDDISKLYSKASSTNSGSLPYLNLTDNYNVAGGDMSPLSSPDKELSGDPFHSSSEFDLDLAEDGDPTMDFDDTEDSLFSSYPDPLPPPPSSLDPLPDNALLREKPVHTYSRNSTLNQHTYSKSSPGPSSSVTSDPDAATSSAAPPLSSQSPTTSNGICSSAPPPLPSSFSAAANDSTSQPSSSSTAAPPPPPAAAPPVNSNSHQPSHPSFSKSSDPLPMGASSRRARDHMVQVASQSLQQQQASRMLLASVSQSLETLAQSVQLLVEAQQEFVQESLMMQRETVDILRDFSNTALAMLRDKGNAGQPTTHHPPARF